MASFAVRGLARSRNYFHEVSRFAARWRQELILASFAVCALGPRNFRGNNVRSGEYWKNQYEMHVGHPAGDCKNVQKSTPQLLGQSSLQRAPANHLLGRARIDLGRVGEPLEYLSAAFGRFAALSGRYLAPLSVSWARLGRLFGTLGHLFGILGWLLVPNFWPRGP